MRSSLPGVVIPFVLLAGCGVDLDPDGLEDDTDTVTQFGGGPGGGSSEPPPAPCTAPTSPSHPVRYQTLEPDEAKVFDLPAGCTKYFSIIAKGFTNTEILVFSAFFTDLGANENPDLHTTIVNDVPGPASGGCHSVNPPGEPEDCFVSDPGHPNAEFLIKIAVRATTELTGVAIVANQYSAL
jgi:hypothetical protein